MSVAKVIQTSGFRPTTPKAREPLWRGPEDPGPQGGVTQSLISVWLQDRERARIKLIEGLQPPDTFSHRMEYGSMVHLAIERYSGAVKGRDYKDEVGRIRHALSGVTEYAQQLCRRYPTQQEQVSHWWEVCKVQFPLYVEFWAKHHDDEQRTPLLQEQTFHVPYQLPSGRTVYLRGKWDGVVAIKKGKESGVWLHETKSKGDIREGQIQRQLLWDLQTGLYMTALTESVYNHERYAYDNNGKLKPEWKGPILGVRYDVIKRPLSNGKGTIVRHKATKNHPEETKEHFYGRVRDIINESSSDYFMRWRVDVRPHDIERFRERCLDPILEMIAWWYDVVALKRDPKEIVREFGPPPCHFTHPFQAWGNPLLEGGTTEYDEYITTGNSAGLTEASELFSELSDA